MKTEILNTPVLVDVQSSVKNNSRSINKISRHIDRDIKDTSTNKILIYLVDDDRILLHTLQHTLTSMHHERIEIKTFTSAEACIEESKLLQPSIIILDYYLDGNNNTAMNGSMALRRFKYICPDAKVIMLSSQNNIDIALLSIKNNAHDYVSKGINSYSKIKSIVRHIAMEIEMNEKLKKQNSLMRYLNWGFIVFYISMVFLFQNAFKFKSLKDQAMDGDKTTDSDKNIAWVIDSDKNMDGDKISDGDKSIAFVIDSDNNIDSDKNMDGDRS